MVQSGKGQFLNILFNVQTHIISVGYNILISLAFRIAATKRLEGPWFLRDVFHNHNVS